MTQGAGDGGNSGAAAGGGVPSAPGTGTSNSRPGAGGGGAGGRETFAADELAVILSHFDLGVVDSITEFPRGSRKAPKVLVTAEHGKYLLKRRARGRDDPFKVAFCHALQLHLAAQQFPLPHLIGTRRENNSMLQARGAVYELFEYIPGQGYPQTLEATFDSGRVLALFHKLLDGFVTEWQPPGGSYHAADGVEAGLRAIPGALGGAQDPELRALAGELLRRYREAAQLADAAGLGSWPKQIVHADWHPGNMLFRDNHVVAVIDYDSARLLPRVIDAANGALQFSILGGDDDVNRWPEYLDEARFKRFLRGYDEVSLMSSAELRAVPHLMAEALIAEAVFPIAATGTFGRMEGVAFLKMVQRKLSWLRENYDRIVAIAEGAGGAGGAGS